MPTAGELAVLMKDVPRIENIDEAVTCLNSLGHAVKKVGRTVYQIDRERPIQAHALCDHVRQRARNAVMAKWERSQSRKGVSRG